MSATILVGAGFGDEGNRRVAHARAILGHAGVADGLDDVADERWAQRLVERDDQPWTSPRAPAERYDLDAAPNERDDLVGDAAFAEALASLREQLVGHMEGTNDPLLGETFEETAG